MYYEEDNAANKSLSNNEIFHILNKEVIKNIIYPSRRSDITQQYMTCTKYPLNSLNLLLDFMKNDISRLKDV